MPINNNILDVLKVIQICDSNFPIGSFNHSYGMETYLRLKKVYNTETFREWLKVYLNEQFIFSDGLAIKMLYEYLNNHDLESIWDLDNRITVQTVAIETRNGGKLVNKEAFGHPAIVFGMLMYSLGFSLKEAIIYHMYSTISTLISNAVRTIPLGQKDGQLLLKEFSEQFENIYKTLINLDDDYFGATSPGLELSQIKHEVMEFRLFMS